MKEKLHRFLSCLMGLLLLASTISWTVGKHYCMGQLMDVSFFAHAEDCGMGKVMDDDWTLQLEIENSCCDDEMVIVEGQDVLKLAFEDIRFEQQLYAFTFSHSYRPITETTFESQFAQEYYPPPLLVKDLQLLDEVFLI